MNVQVTGNPKPFGIIGLVIAIFSCIFSFIPCIGFYAIGPAILAIMFSVIAFVSLKHIGQATNMALAGIIVGVVAIGIGSYQYVTYKEVFKAKKDIENSFNEIDREVTNKILDTIAKANESKLKNDSVHEAQKDTIQW